MNGRCQEYSSDSHNLYEHVSYIYTTVLPPAPAAKHVTLLIPLCLQMHQSLTKSMHLHLSWKITLLLMQRTDAFCRYISKRLLSGKAPSHEVDTFTHIKGLPHMHVMDSNEKYLGLVIPKSWCFTVLVEAYDKLGHWGVNRTYHLIKQQYYWKGMNKVSPKYINNCALCKREKTRTRVYPPQMTDIPGRPFDKIAIDLVSDLNVSASGNQHILTIIDHLAGLLEAFPIPDKKVDTIVHVFINNYLPVHMHPCFILSDNGT